jgi:hypothetical protein
MDFKNKLVFPSMAAMKERKVLMRILRFKSDCGHLGFVVDTEALERVFSQYFSLPY